MGGKAGRPKAPSSTPLGALQAVGLFLDLDEPDGDLKDAIERYLRDSDDEIALASPQSVASFTGSIDVDVSKVIADDPDQRIVHVAGATYKPKTHHHWVATYNAALEAIGDERRFVSYDTADWEEPVYVLVTPAQERALDAAELLAYDTNEIALPRAVDSEERLEQIAETLRGKGVTADHDGDRIVLDLDLAAAQRLIARLRAAAHHDERVSAYVAHEYK